MGLLFDIPSEVFDLARDGISDFIDQLGKPCRLYYPPTFEACVGCSDTSPHTSQGPNRWITGGFVPQGASGCPQCGGAGQQAIERYDTVTLLLDWSDMDKLKPIGSADIAVPLARITTKGYIKDVSKILRCSYMVVMGDLEGVVLTKFERDGEPTDRSNIAKNKFFTQVWKRVP